MNKPSQLAAQSASAVSVRAVPSAPPLPRRSASVVSVAPVESPPCEAESVDEFRARRRAPQREEFQTEAEYKRKWREWWAEMGREARESSIRRGTYNPGNWPLNPDYEPDREKALARMDEIRAMSPRQPSSTPYIRRCRDLDFGNGCTEEELKEL